MLIRSKIAPALLAGVLVASCGGSGPNEPIIPEPTKPFTSLPKGSFSVALKRTGAGTLPGDKNIYVQIINQPCKNSSPCAPNDTTQVTYVTLEKIRITDGPNGTASLGKVQIAPANMVLPSFKISDLTNGNLILPGDSVYAGRIYISVGAPISMKVDQLGQGYIQPNLNDPNDPNMSIPFDFLEIAYDAKPKSTTPSENTVAFGANLTQVDQFVMPLSFKLTGVSGTVYERGITIGADSSSGAMTREEIIQNYLATVSAPFKTLVQTTNGQTIRILAPYHSPTFQLGGSAATFYDNYVDQVWNYFKTTPTIIYDQPGNIGNKYEVSGDGTTLTVKRNDGTPYPMQKPSTLDVFRNNGNLLPGNPDIDAFGAMLSGALNRHVADQPADWLTPDKYYQASPKHDYAEFWHPVSIGNLAYGFGFDDTAGQSSVAILKPTENASSLNVDIGW